MPRNAGKRDEGTKEIEKSRKENADIQAEKARTEDVKKLKTLEELMKEDD